MIRRARHLLATAPQSCAHNVLAADGGMGARQPAQRHLRRALAARAAACDHPGRARLRRAPGVPILCCPFWLRFPYATPVLITKVRMESADID
eukprot:COSAG01_NODE_373_length_17991_cov_284.890075_19_plen_93_part_00